MRRNGFGTQLPFLKGCIPNFLSPDGTQLAFSGGCVPNVLRSDGTQLPFLKGCVPNILRSDGMQTLFSGGCVPKHADTRRHFPKQPSISYYPTKNPSVITTEGYAFLLQFSLFLKIHHEYEAHGDLYHRGAGCRQPYLKE